MIETYSGNKGFTYGVFIDADCIEEFSTPAKAKREAREQARLCEGMMVYVVKYREIYTVKEEEVGE